MAHVRELARGDVVRFLEAERPLKAKAHRALIFALLDLTSGESGPPAIDAEILRQDLERRTGGTIRPASFRQQLSRVNTVLENANAPFKLATRGGRIVVEATAHWDRASQMNLVGQALVEHSGEKMRGDLDSFVPPRALPDRLLVMWSYAWLPEEQQAVQIALFDALKRKLTHPPTKYRHLPKIELWRDEERVNPAESGTQQMDEACAGAFLGILVLSDKYPHSAICMREASHFLDEYGDNQPEKRCIVLRFNCEIHEMDARFCRRVVVPAGDEGHLLKQWVKGDVDDRNDIAAKLAGQIFENADQWCRQPRALPHAPSRAPAGSKVERFVAEQPGRMRHDDIHSTAPLARAGADGYDVAVPQATAETGGIDIVERLIEWAGSDDPTRPRITALLGDFGMGKTVTCQLVCRRMVERLNQGEDLPTPVYFDLRDIPKPDRPEQVTLTSLIDDLLRRAGGAAPNAAEVIDFIRSRKALVIFDGLDEITNKYTIDVGRIIYRQLISIVPGSVWEDDARRRRAQQSGPAYGPPRGGPSILLSCRSQYFADFAAERGFLTDSDRSGLKLQEDISVYVMLPFNPGQIRDYLARNLPEDDRDRALKLIESTYDLGALARRPILLRYIGELVHRLEAEKLAGRTINLSRLYDILVSQTFERDSGKHVIPIADKKRLLEALAVYLHRRQLEDISNERLVDWVDQEIAAHFPRLASALASDSGLSLSEVFVQDLRNATLLSRPTEGGFRFAHTSMREFFLASALYRAAGENRALEIWEMNPPSSETVDFILQRYALDDTAGRAAFDESFVGLLDPGRPLLVRQLAFTVWRQGMDTGQGLPRPQRMDCSGFALRNALLSGTKRKPLPLADSIWHGAILEHATFEDVDLSDADLDGVNAIGCRFVRCRLANTRFTDSRLDGSIWRECQLDRDALAGARLRLASAYETSLGGEPWRPQRDSPADAHDWHVRRRETMEHVGGASTCSLDGRSVIAVAAGREIRIIDAETGVNIRNLEGHGARVRSLLFVVMDARPVLISTAEDNSVQLWNLQSGLGEPILEHVVDAHEILGVATCEGRVLIGWKSPVQGAQIQGLYDNKPLPPAVVDENGAVAALVSLEDRALLVSYDQAGIRLTDMMSGEVVRTIDALQGATRISLSEIDGRQVLVSTSGHRMIRVFDIGTGTSLYEVELERDIFEPVGLLSVDNRPAVAIRDGTGLEFRDLSDGKILHSLERYRGSFTHAALVHLNGRPAIASGAGLTLRLRGVEDEAASKTFAEHTGAIRSVISHDLDRIPVIASTSDDGTIRLWNARTADLIRAWDAHPGGSNAIAFATLEGKSVIASVGDDGTARLWSASSGSALRTFRRVGKITGVAWMMSVDTAVLEGRLVIAAGDIKKTVTIWDAKSGKVLRSLKAHKDWVRALAFGDHRGRPVLATGSDDKSVRIWDARTWKAIHILREHNSPVTALAFGHLDDHMVLVSGGFDETIRIWDVQSGEIVREIGCGEGWINSVQFSSLQGHPAILVGQYGKIVSLIRLGSDGPAETRMYLHDPDVAITVSHARGGDRVVSADDAAWKHFVASYQYGAGRMMTELDDMPRKKRAAA